MLAASLLSAHQENNPLPVLAVVAVVAYLLVLAVWL
jgi:hypothetical protein